MSACILLLSGTMAPIPKKNEIQTLQTRLCDEPSDIEATAQASGSMEMLGVHPDEGIEQ